MRTQMDTKESGHTEMSTLPEQGLAGKEGVIGMDMRIMGTVIGKELKTEEMNGFLSGLADSNQSVTLTWIRENVATDSDGNILWK